MFPTIATLSPLYLILKNMNLLNTYAALILPSIIVPLGTFILTQSFKSVPDTVLDAAMLDGCSKIGVLFKILVPVVQPSIVTASIFAFYWIWQDFFQPLIFVSNPKNFTIPLALKLYTDPNSYNNYGGLFAMSVISLLPVILIFIKFQKYLVEGIATDGIKG